MKGGNEKKIGEQNKEEHEGKGIDQGTAYSRLMFTLCLRALVSKVQENLAVFPRSHAYTLYSL
jgi:hypothetical protein